MRTTVVCCKTLYDELNQAINRTGVDCSVCWLEPGLHNVPGDLRSAVQEVFERITCDRVLLAMGVCGNALSGVKIGNFEVILPRVSDCVSLLLGEERRKSISVEKGTYFLTRGWLEGERNIWVEYNYAIEKYGEKMGKRIYSMMFAHYKELGVIDTGSYDFLDILDETHMIADTIGLEHTILRASTDHLCDLLRGPWHDKDYFRFPPKSKITLTWGNAQCQ